MTTERILFALALLHIDGVGRVTAARLLEQFADFEDLRRYPREQVLHRIKGARNRQQLVNNLFDDAFLDPHRTYARDHLRKLRERDIQVVIIGDEHWPHGFSMLDASHRPVYLYVYGEAENLNSSGAAVFAKPPLQEGPFEWAQDLVRRFVDRQVTVIGGLANGFDNVIQKLCISEADTSRSVMVTNCGLAKIPAGLRSTAGQAVRSGSVMISSFPMGHGPYDHDDFERALLQAALSAAAVFIEPRPDTPEWRALKWMTDIERPAYVLPHPDHEPPGHTTRVTTQTPIQDIVLPDLPT